MENIAKNTLVMDIYNYIEKYVKTQWKCQRRSILLQLLFKYKSIRVSDRLGQ